MAAPDGKVNVFGPAESILRGERYCTTADAGQQVVYHARSVTLSNGGWSCLVCASSSTGPDGRA